MDEAQNGQRQMVHNCKILLNSNDIDSEKLNVKHG